MLSDALSFPRRGDDWLPTLLVGGVLTLLGVLILPAIIVQGYLVRVLAAAANNERTPPSFTEWGRLFVDGLKLLVVNIVYGLLVIVPLVAVLVPVAVVSPTSPVPVEPGTTPTPPTPGSGTALVLLAGLLVVLLAALVLSYVLPAALAHFAMEGQLRAAFDIPTILSGALTTEYAVAWLLALVVGLVGGLVGSVLSAVVVGVFVLFYVQVSFYYLLGRGFARGLSKKQWTEPG